MKRALDIAAIVLTSLLLLGFVVLSLRGLIDPQTASARFGAPVSDAAGALFYRVYLSRNLVDRRLRRDFSALAAMDGAGRPFDRSRGDALVRHVGAIANGVTPPPVHPVALALLGITAALLWRRARSVRV